MGAALPQIAVLGFTNVRARGGTYRVFSMQTRSQVIQAEKNTAARCDMACSLALECRCRWVTTAESRSWWAEWSPEINGRK